MNYRELLKDPRWQKRRLEIMQRDNFTCMVCNRSLNDGIPLNVHHRQYIPGRKPWEYESHELVTLCENCHKKIHDGLITLPSPKIKNKEYVTIFYKDLFNYRNQISGTEAIVFSNLIKISLRDKSNIIGSSLKIAHFSRNELAKKCFCVPHSVRNSIKNLTANGFIKDDFIENYKDYTTHGYVRIEHIDDVKGWQLIDYAIIKERSIGHNNTIDTWASKLAENLHTTKENVYMTIMRLKEKGYVERLPNGKLRIK